MRLRAALIVTLVAAAVAATFTGYPLAAATATDLVSIYVEAGLPLTDPASALWERAPALEVPMSGQAVARPMAPNPSVNTVTVRSLNDGKWIAFRIEWDDATKNEGLGHDAFKDSAAVQLPAKGGQPFYCMGVAGGEVNILHWRSDFQADIERGGGPTTVNMNPAAVPAYYPLPVAAEPNFRAALGAANPIAQPDKRSPVESLAAGGFGTLSSSGLVQAAGWASWAGGKWSAVLARPLVTADLDDADLESEAQTSVAFAVWDGGRGDISGKKTISSWVTLGIGSPGVVAEPAAQTPPAGTPASAQEASEAAPVGARAGRPAVATWVLIGVLWFLSLIAAWVVGQGALSSKERP